jgi:2,4-dienoyl-CoA reductase-like NADH-dependent reductase (Old Yellow Enzyme family)/thioredoxin reductase
MASTPMILTPIRLGSVEVRNRVVITAHGASEMFRNPLLPAEPYIEYLRRRAGGGVGLIIAQALYVNPLAAYPDAFTERHARLAQAVKSEGATLLLQLVNLGATFRSESDVHRPPLWGFSTTVTDQGEVAHAMSDEQVEMMIAGYGRIARMAAEAGFDGCEVHGAHGYIGQQSISPWLNRRTDKWGQDRMLFLRRVIEIVRQEIGPDRVLGYRTTTDDMRAPDEGGLGPAGAAETVRAVLATGEIDVLNTTVGNGGKTYTRAIPSYRLGEAVNMPRARQLADAIGHQVPMIGVGRIASVGVAESLLQSGACEMVAMTRAHIADPDIVAKLARSEAHRIRPCVGALVCNSRKLAGFSEISCLHNPEVLREHELHVERAAAPQRVVVVGAGPAGLKFAEIAARRGHHVRVYDEAARTGGRLRATEKTAASDLASAVDHLTSELALLEVPVKLGITVDEELLRAAEADYLVLATGAEPDPGPAFLGAETTQVLSSTEALTVADAEIDHDVLVYDALGANDGALVAEALANRGRRVYLVTPYETVMPYGGISHRMETPDILRRRLAGIYTEATVGAADGRNVFVVRADGEDVAELEVGTIVAVTAPSPRLELAAVATRLGLPYAVVGDAMAPRQATDAFREGELAALAL